MNLDAAGPLVGEVDGYQVGCREDGAGCVAAHGRCLDGLRGVSPLMFSPLHSTILFSRRSSLLSSSRRSSTLSIPSISVPLNGSAPVAASPSLAVTPSLVTHKTKRYLKLKAYTHLLRNTT